MQQNIIIHTTAIKFSLQNKKNTKTLSARHDL